VRLQSQEFTVMAWNF